MTDKKIPRDVYECFEHLDDILTDSEDRNWFMTTSEEDAVIQTHEGLGEFIRSNWGIYSGDSDIYLHFKNLGLHHPDDISGVIITSYHRRLNQKDLDLAGQIGVIVDFWKGQKKKDAGK